ncbi:MAG: phosphoglycerate kinase [Nitrososphaerales archaeon]|jgi:phosphoglycerate kinase
MMYDKLQPYRLVNLGRQLRSPALVRVDINLPVDQGRVQEDALRMRVYAHVLELYSEYAGLVVMSHQGRMGDEDFTSMIPHLAMLRKFLPGDVDTEFVPNEEVFTEETRRKIGGLGRRQILLLDNVRYFEEEKRWQPEGSRYLSLFRGSIRTCVNDSVPTWHREDSSLMCLPYVAQTYVGLRSSYELRILKEVAERRDSKALIMGGAKLQKVSDLVKIATKGVEIFTGGLPGQLIARSRGYDLGEANNEYLAHRFRREEFEDARELDAIRNRGSRLALRHPVDFVVEEDDGSRRNVRLEDMPGARGVIKDIGAETLESYAESLQEKPIRVRAGPLGVYEEGYDNGLELTKRICGDGLVFLGGDTSQELNHGGLLGTVEDSGGSICVSGGSFLHGWAGGRFPSVDALMSMQAPLVLDRA